jgi:hypothetical protein
MPDALARHFHSVTETIEATKKRLDQSHAAIARSDRLSIASGAAIAKSRLLMSGAIPLGSGAAVEIRKPSSKLHPRSPLGAGDGADERSSSRKT